MSLTVATGLSTADEILGFFGLDPKTVLKGFLKGGDKKQRLEKIEMAGSMAALYVANTLRAIENESPETASRIKDGLLVTLSQTLAGIVKEADLDGSSGGGQ